MRTFACLLALLAIPACSRVTPQEAALALQARMRAECIYLGEWRATRPGADYTVTLDDDGRFHAAPNGNSRGAELTGRWGVVEGRMVWLYDQMPGKKAEMNPIEPVTDDVFDLVEDDKSKTRYARLGDVRDCRKR